MPQRLQACTAQVWALPFSLAATGGISSFSVPLGTEMFHFPRCRSLPPIEFSGRSCSMTRTGLPHSETSGSKPVCGSPEHIAAYHVLHRLLTPSHPPQTLRSLTFVFSRAKPIHVLETWTVYWRPTACSTVGLIEDVRLPL